jgi:hypothetical protein
MIVTIAAALDGQIDFTETATIQSFAFRNSQQ